MSEASGDGEQEGFPYIRLPWPLVAGGLLVFLALLLAAGIYANRNLRPLTGPAATPAVAALATATVPVSGPTATPAPDSPRTTPAPTALAPVSSVATATALIAATAAAAPPVEVPATVTSAPVPTARPTVSPELVAEVGDAYKQYWDVRAEALYDLDTSRLQEIVAGEHLAALEDRINELRIEGRAIQTDVDHQYFVVEATDDNASVVDTYVERSIYVDVQTHTPISSPSGETITELYTMANVNGSWRVVSLVRSP